MEGHRAYLKCCAVAATLFFCTLPASSAEVYHLAVAEILRPSTVTAKKVLTVAYAQLGIQLDFIALPFRRGLVESDAGKIDGVAYRIVDDGHNDLIKIDVPIAYEEAVVFTVNHRFTPAGYESLKPYKVGYVFGIPYLDIKLKGLQAETAPNLESLFKKLEANRTDVAVDSPHSACVAKKLGLNDIVILEPALDRQVGYHFIHKNHQSLIPRLEAVLRQMEKDGTIRKIQAEVIAKFMEDC